MHLAVHIDRPTDCFSSNSACRTLDLPVPLGPMKTVISLGLTSSSRKHLKFCRVMFVIMAATFRGHYSNRWLLLNSWTGTVLRFDEAVTALR